MLGARYLLPERPLTSLDEFLAAGGGDGLRAARLLGADAVIEEVTASGLRGRGGAGFPTGTKWASVRAGGGGRRHVVANGAEGEPATAKDRLLMRRDPYRVVEGAAIAAVAVDATEVHLATKRSFAPEVSALRRAAVEMSEAGLVGDLTITIVEGPEDYLFGEETALLEVIEGRDPYPRLLPPWQHGLFATASAGGWEAEPVTARGDSNPTVVNNVETLATAAHVLAKGADWFRTMGTAASPGTILVTVVGDVRRAGVHEVELGTPFGAVLDECGGPLPGRRWRAALSGVSNPVLLAADFDVPLTHEDFTERGSGLGAAGFAVYDDRVDMLDVAREVSRFLAVESCGQCPSCKEGCVRITERLQVIAAGRGDAAAVAEAESWLRKVTDGNRCSLGRQEQVVVSSILRAFPDDLAAHLRGAGTPGRPVSVALVADVTEDGEPVLDQQHQRRRPG